MALFQKKPDVGNSAPLYSIGSNKSILIIGLGNVGKKYDGTRHNIGFEILDHFADKNDFPSWVTKKDLFCELTQQTIGSARVTLVKPTTFMNDSGKAAQAVQHFYRIYNQNTIAVYDELAIPFGQIRTRIGGQSAGHNGVKSLIQHIEASFGRLRIGVGNEFSDKADATDFVLGKFTKEEQQKIPLILRESNALLTEYIFSESLAHETRSILD